MSECETCANAAEPAPRRLPMVAIRVLPPVFRSYRQAETLAMAVRFAFPMLECQSGRESVFVESPMFPEEAVLIVEAAAYALNYGRMLGFHV